MTSDGLFEIGEKLLLVEKILAWIAVNEPVTDFKELIDKSEVAEETLRMNIERLHEAGLIGGRLIKTVAKTNFVHAINIKLTYQGLKELEKISKEKNLTKGVEINLGALKFKL